MKLLITFNEYSIICEKKSYYAKYLIKICKLKSIEIKELIKINIESNEEVLKIKKMGF